MVPNRATHHIYSVRSMLLYGLDSVKFTLTSLVPSYFFHPISYLPQIIPAQIPNLNPLFVSLK